MSFRLAALFLLLVLCGSNVFAEMDIKVWQRMSLNQKTQYIADWTEGYAVARVDAKRPYRVYGWHLDQNKLSDVKRDVKAISGKDLTDWIDAMNRFYEIDRFKDLPLSAGMLHTIEVFQGASEEELDQYIRSIRRVLNQLEISGHRSG